MNDDGSPKTRKVGPPPLKPGVDYVNPEEEDQMEIYGYQSCCWLQVVTWIMICLTLGLLRLVFHWKKHWMLTCTHNKCSLRDAEKVLLIDHFNQIFVEDIITLRSSNSVIQSKKPNGEIESYGALNSPELLRPKMNGTFEAVDSLRFFENKKLRYFYSLEMDGFMKICSMDKNTECCQFYQMDGLSVFEEILFNEVLGPFYVFQVFSIILWALEPYIMYASCIVVMSSLSLISSVIQIRRNQTQLRDTVQGMDAVTVYRGHGVFEEIESHKLVPGDIIAIPPHGCVMQCDAVLISGNVIVNESMLTGESVPVTKIPIPDIKHKSEIYNSKEHAKHTLFCGTKVIQTRYYDGAKVRAVVLRTGFLTAKGELVRSIMFPKPVDFKFNRHVYKFIRYLAILAAVGFIYTVILKANRQVPVTDILLKALDLVTIIIPPALPMAMTIGVIFAQTRLKKSNIYCISPRSINISGCINCVCFDKTGTLTEDDLSFSQVVPVDHNSNSFGPPIHDLKLLDTSPLLMSLTTCHSLTLIEGSIIGDPLDQKMFEATGWILEEPNVDDTAKYDLLAPSVVRPANSCPISEWEQMTGDEVGILRQFPFSSSLQRMSVVTRNLRGSQFEVYVKGSPEVILSLSAPESIPEDFDQTLMEYTLKGFRVLGLAYRPLNTTYVKMQRATREDIEKNLTFVGLLVMGNMLKPETTAVIDILHNADIRSVMVTGDNMLTALSVARECHMIRPKDKVIILETYEREEDEMPRLVWNYADHVKRRESISGVNVNLFRERSIQVEERLHVAITGKTFGILREYYPETLSKIAIRGTVFSRMAPDQKQQLIELLQDLGYYVGMCGDGANDCGALKAAHAGVSLSETEASVASPFTSKTPNISCFPILIREGRTSLVTAFGILKYMACYSVCQFASVILLYTFYSNLTDMQFLYEDLFLISLFFVVFGRTESYETLSRKAPPSSLIGVTPLCSLALQIILIVAFQVLAVVLLWRQPWYVFHIPTDDEDLKCHDNYAVFSVSVFQYITLAVVFSKGAPYRKAIYTNYSFLASLIVMTIFTAYIVVWPPEWAADIFEFQLENVTLKFRLMMLFLAIINFILAFVAESFIVDYIIFIKLKEWMRKITSRDTLYDKIYMSTRSPDDWLPAADASEITSLNKKTSFQPLQKSNGFAHFTSASGAEDSSSEAQKQPLIRESPVESGICISSPTSVPLSPGSRSLDGFTSSEPMVYRSVSVIPCSERQSSGCWTSTQGKEGSDSKPII